MQREIGPARVEIAWVWGPRGSVLWLVLGVCGRCFFSFGRAWNHVKHVVLRLGGLDISGKVHAITLVKYEVLARGSAFSLDLAAFLVRKMQPNRGIL